MSWLGYTRQKVSEYVDFVKLELSVILLAHITACIWIEIGKANSNSWVNVFIDEKIQETGVNEILYYDYATEIYSKAFYFILSTITTVGYGDITGKTV